VVVDILNVAAVRDDAAGITSLLVLRASQLGETPLVRDQELLAAGKLVLGATQSLNDDSLVGVLSADGNQGLANGDTGNGAVRLTESTTHTGLETIGTGTGQHLVDAQDVEGMDTDTHVEGLLARVLRDVLVGSDTGSLQSLAADLLDFVGKQMDTEGELVGGGLLTAQIEDLDLGVGDSTAETRLGVRLVLAVAVATSRTTTHLE